MFYPNVKGLHNVGSLKKYRHCMNPTACAIKFTKAVGADLHIRPKVESSHKENRRLTYWLNRRLYSAPTVQEILFQQSQLYNSQLSRQGKPLKPLVVVK